MEETVQFLLAFKGYIVVSWFIVIFSFEHFFAKPARLKGGSEAVVKNIFLHRLARNFMLFTINVAMGPLFVIYMRFASENSFFDWRGDIWQGPVALLVDLIVLDAIIYWWHRLNHEIPFLWRFHEVHHLDEALDSTTALRFHAGEVALSALFRSGFVILLDIPLGTVVLAETLILIAAIFHHGNFALPQKLNSVISKIIITPNLHWTHHQARKKDTDSNYGNILACWDMVFQSRNLDKTHKIRIGVEGKKDSKLKNLIFDPFRFSKKP